MVADWDLDALAALEQLETLANDVVAPRVRPLAQPDLPRGDARRRIPDERKTLSAPDVHIRADRRTRPQRRATLERRGGGGRRVSGEGATRSVHRLHKRELFESGVAVAVESTDLLGQDKPVW